VRPGEHVAGRRTDPLRPEAPAVIHTLRSQGIRELVILTGDQPTVAR